MAQALFVYADPPQRDKQNTSRYRIFTPAKYLRQAGHEIGETYFANIGDVPNVVLLERYISSHQYGNIVKRLRDSGAKRIIATFDDNYALMPFNEYSREPYEFWHRGDNLQRFRDGLKECDAVITPSKKLCQYYAECNAQYLPNYFDDDHWEFPAKPYKTDTDEIVIGWGGSSQHILSWKDAPILKALRMIQAEFSNTRLVIYGRHISSLLERAGIVHEVREWTTFDEWSSKVAEFDIGLAPLRGEYDDYRSNIKVLEYGLAHVAPVYSYRPPYHELPTELGMNCTTADDWYSALRRLCSSAEYRRSVAQVYYTHAQDYLMSKRVKEYENLLWG